MNDLLAPTCEFVPGAAAGSWIPRAAARVDLHCHSTFSDERIRWLPGVVFHPMLEPHEVYRTAKSRGMDFVTITDHDTIDGCQALLDRYGDLPDFIVGEEVTTAFPEDGTVVHVNVFDHNEAQHGEIQRLRTNIYELVAYLRSIDKLYVINHLTWTAQHRVLSSWQIEAMLRLFDVFEGLNGTRSYAHNAFAWKATRGHGKVLVAGSDSHSNRMGTTYTVSEGATRAALLASIRAGRAAMCGAFGTPEKLREDIWLVMHRNARRRIEQERRAWRRFAVAAAEQVGRVLCPLACLGYHKRQNSLIQGFLRALPT